MALRTLAAEREAVTPRSGGIAMMPATIPEVMTVVGGYRVNLKGQLHLVSKQRACSCRRPHCPAIQAVATYLQAGGRRAPAADSVTGGIPFPCPICQAQAHGSLATKDWTCTIDRIHYFEWRVQRIRVVRAKALQCASPYVHEVLTAFASNEARAAFLSTHALTYPASA
jgi:hypothetical protein